jgi:hypothetical protein
MAGMVDLGSPKAVLQHYLQQARDDLIWKLDGLSEREARLPRTASGNNLLGIIKHCLHIEVDCFGPAFGRDFPTDEELVFLSEYLHDPQAHWYAREDETKDGLIDLYRRVWDFADQTIEQLSLEARGRVWWRGPPQVVTLHQVMIHVTCELSRHAGHADILREQYDGAVGRQDEYPAIPGFDWPAYVTKLTKLADRFG